MDAFLPLTQAHTHSYAIFGRLGCLLFRDIQIVADGESYQQLSTCVGNSSHAHDQISFSCYYTSLPRRNTLHIHVFGVDEL